MSKIYSCCVCDSSNAVICCDVCRIKCCENCLTEHKRNNSCTLLKEYCLDYHECQDHSKLVKGFCLSCSKLTCPDCDIHVSHDIESLEYAFKNIHSSIPDYLIQLSENESEAKKFIESVTENKNVWMKIDEGIKQQGLNLRKLLIRTRDCLRKELNRYEIQFESMCLDKAKYIEQIRKTSQNVNLLTHVKSPAVFLQIWTEIKSQLNQEERCQAPNFFQKKIIEFRSTTMDLSKFGEIYGSIVWETDKERNEMLTMAEHLCRSVFTLCPPKESLLNVKDKGVTFTEMMQYAIDGVHTLVSDLKQAKLDLDMYLKDSVKWKDDQSENVERYCSDLTMKCEEKICKTMRGEIKHLREEQRNLTDLIRKLQEQLMSKDKEVENLHTEIQKLEQKRRYFLKRIKELRSRITELSNEKDRLQNIVDAGHNEIKSLEKCRDELIDRVNMQPASTENITVEINKLNSLVSEKEDSIGQLQKENSDLQSRVSMQASSIKNDKHEIEQLKSLLTEKNDVIIKLQKEKDDFQTRLSSIAGDKLTKGNPSITDLGDPNRPMKIGEKYGELYDNEWTDAMECTDAAKRFYPEKTKSEIEEIVIQHLYTILICCYTECRKLATEQIQCIGDVVMKTIFLSIEQAEKDPTQIPGYKDIANVRRKTGEQYAQFLLQNGVFKSKIANMESQGFNKNEEVLKLLLHTKFFEKCVCLCWYMGIQDPAMHLDDGPKQGTIFDKNLYKEFVKSGDKVKYIVWPALLLHKGGPVLYKGVVQPY